MNTSGNNTAILVPATTTSCCSLSSTSDPHHHCVIMKSKSSMSSLRVRSRNDTMATSNLDDVDCCLLQQYERSSKMLKTSSTSSSSSSSAKSSSSSTTATTISMSLNERGMALYQLGQYDHAGKYFTTALEAAGVCMNIEDQLSKETEKDTNHHYDEGLDAYNGVLPIDVESSSSSSSAILLYNMGQVYVARGQYEHAIKAFQKSIDQIMIAMVVSSLSTSTSQCHLGMMVKVHYNLGKCHFHMTSNKDSKALALQHYQQSLSIGIKCSLNHQPTLATLLNAVGAMYFHMDDENLERKKEGGGGDGDKKNSSQDHLNKAMDMFQQSHAMSRQGLPTTTATSSSLFAIVSERYVSEATILNNIGRVHYIRGNYKQAIHVYEQSLKVRRNGLMSSSSNDCLDVAATLFNIGTTYGKLFNYQYAIKYLKEYIDIVQEHHAAGNSKLGMDLVHAYKAMAENYYECHDTFLAINSYEHGVQVMKSMKTKGEFTSTSQAYQELISLMLIQLGNHSFEVKKYDQALKYFKEGLVIEVELYGKCHPNTIITMTNIGHILKTINRKVEALQIYQTVYATIQQGKDEVDTTAANKDKLDRCFSLPFIAELISHVGLLQYQMNDYESAFESYQEALQLRREHYKSDDHLDIASTLNSIGLTLFKQSSLNMAKDCFLESLRIRTTLLGDTHRDLAILYYNIATVYYEQADSPDIALKYYHETLRIEKATLGETHKDVAVTLRHVGQVYQSLGHLDKALECFQEALRIERINSSKTNDESSSATTTDKNKNISKKNTALMLGQILNLIGNVHLQQGNTDKMMTSFVEVIRMYRECDIPESNLIIAGYNFYQLSKTQPPCAPVA